MFEFKTLREANRSRENIWRNGHELDPLFAATELGGEVGEALNVVKKLVREQRGQVGSRDTVEHLAEELADVIICVDLLAMIYDIDTDEAVKVKYNKVSEKNGLPIRYV